MAVKGIAEQLLGISQAGRAGRKKEELTAQALPSPVAAFSEAFERRTGKIFEAEQADVITHEYEIDPYRRNKAEKLAETDIGKKIWGDITKKYNTSRQILKGAREALDNKTYIKYTTTGGKDAVKLTADKITGLPEGELLSFKGSKEDQEIQVVNKGGGLYDVIIVNPNKAKGSRGRVLGSFNDKNIDWILKNNEIAGLIKKGSVLKEGIPGEKIVDKEATAKAKKDLEDNIKNAEADLKDARSRFNKEIPGRSELDKLWADYLALQAAQAKGKDTGMKPGKVSDKYKLKFESNEDLAKRVATGDLKITAVTDEDRLTQIGSFASTYITDLNQGFTERAIELGKVQPVWNRSLTAFRQMDEDMMKRWVNSYENGVNADIDKINELGKSDKKDAATLQLLHGYRLMARVVPVIAKKGKNAKQRLSYEAANAIAKSAFQGVDPAKDFETGEWNMKRFADDIESITSEIIEENSKNWNIGKKTRDMYERVNGRINRDLPKINLKTLWNDIEPKNFPRRLKLELLSELGHLAPSNASDYNKVVKELLSNKQTPKALWLELYTEANGGRLPNYNLLKEEKKRIVGVGPGEAGTAIFRDILRL